MEKTYPQSRVTLYKALRKLTERDYLTMNRGTGTYVKATHVRARIAVLAGAGFFQSSLTPFALRMYNFV